MSISNRMRMNEEYSGVCNFIFKNEEDSYDGTNEVQNNYENLNLEYTYGIPERVINFKRRKITELDGGDTSVILLDDDTVIQPEVEVHIKKEDEEGTELVDEEGNTYIVIDSNSSEDEYINYVNTELEEGEIREGRCWNNGHNSLNNYQSERTSYVCALCQKPFTQKGNLLRHFQTHTGEKPYVCKLCGHQFTQKSNLDKHLATHNGEKKFLCGICDKGFVQKANLMRHIRVHTGEKPFQCDLCGHEFTQKGNLNKHLELHNSSTNNVCDTCGCTFVSYNAKLRHDVTHHKLRSNNYDEDSLSKECTECPATFKNRKGLSKHMRCHKKMKQKK